MEVATCRLIVVDVPVDRFVAQFAVNLALDRGADLLGTPLLLAQLAGGKGQQSGIAALPSMPPAIRVALSAQEAVVATSAKTAQLPANRRGMLADCFGNFLLLRTIGAHRFDGVALFTGQAAVDRHGGSAWSLSHEPSTAPGPWPLANPADCVSRLNPLRIFRSAASAWISPKVSDVGRRLHRTS